MKMNKGEGMTTENKNYKGLEVYTSDNKMVGTVEDIYDMDFLVAGQRIPNSMVKRVDKDKLYLNTSSTQYNQNTDQMNIPVVEEQLNVSKQAVEMGEVGIHKTVTTEQKAVGVDLRREEVNVNKVDVSNRPLTAEEANNAFQEGTIRVPVRGEQAVVSKQAVVTGEVVVDKTMKTEHEEVRDTVRKERVEVDQNHNQTTGNTQTRTTEYANTSNQNPDMSGNRQDYSTTDNGGTVESSQLRKNMEVVSLEGNRIGKIKETSAETFRVERGFSKSDVEVSYSAIQGIQGDKIMLNIANEEFDLL